MKYLNQLIVYLVENFRCVRVTIYTINWCRSQRIIKNGNSSCYLLTYYTCFNNITTTIREKKCYYLKTR